MQGFSRIQKCCIKGLVNHRDRPQIWQGQMILMRNKDSGPQSRGLSTALGRDLVKVEYDEIVRLNLIKTDQLSDSGQTAA